MRWTTHTWFAALALVALSASSSSAQYYDYDATPSGGDAELQQRIVELEAAVARLQSQPDYVPASHSSGSIGGEAAHCCAAPCGLPAQVGQDFFTCHDRCGGWTAGVELMFLRPFATGGDLPASYIEIDANSRFQGSSFDYELTPRFYLGYVGDNGLGIQVRYWQFDHSTSMQLEGFGATETAFGELYFNTLDLELTQQVDFRHSSLTLTGGLRYAHAGIIEQLDEVDILGDWSYRTDHQFSGVGLTGSAAYTRSLTRSGRWQWYTSARGSVLFGKKSYEQHYEQDWNLFQWQYDYTDKVDGAMIGILEIHTGPQYTRPMLGGELFVRAGFEGQLWLDTGTASSLPGDSTQGNMGFAGFGIAAGLAR